MVELLVAVVLVDVGLLALAGATAVAVRRQTEARARNTATNAAANRLQNLGASPCGARAGSTAPPFAEQWSEIDAPTGMRDLRDSVTFVAYGSAHAVVLATRLPC